MEKQRLKYIDGSETGLNPGKIVCVGRNYLEHIQELNNQTPKQVVLFMKPATALLELGGRVHLAADRGPIHFELELSLLVGKELQKTNVEDCLSAIAGYGLALDLTLRGLQSELKKQGLPWEKAKAFDGSCPLTPFIPCKKDFTEPHQFSMNINGQLRQQGDTAKMIRTMAELLSEISHWFSLQPGDIVLTGTPAGVGVLNVGDELDLELDDKYFFNAQIVGESS